MKAEETDSEIARCRQISLSGALKKVFWETGLVMNHPSVTVEARGLMPRDQAYAIETNVLASPWGVLLPEEVVAPVHHRSNRTSYLARDAEGEEEA